jgi:hypothetical protein
MPSPMDLMVDGACAAGLLDEISRTLPPMKPVAVMRWIMEGYGIDETVEGILSNAMIAVLPPALCTCSHTGRTEESQHGPRFGPGHGPCLVEGCACRQFTYEAEVRS